MNSLNANANTVSEKPADCKAKPCILKVASENIPDFLKKQKRWVNWRLEFIDGKWKKPPYLTEKGVKGWQNPEAWADFETAFSAYQSGRYDGISFVLTGDDLNLVGFDFDHCINESGQIKPEVQSFISILDSYAEKSPSGTGIRVFAFGDLPGDRKKAGAYEVYRADKPLSVTGQSINGTAIEHREKQISAVYNAIFPPAKEPSPDYQSEVSVSDLSDSELLEKMFNSKGGERLKRLWYGDKSDCDNDDSKSDFSLCCALAFWTGKDHARIDRLFRQSGLYRKKWDERHGRDTYGNLTIGNAIAKTTDTYTVRSRIALAAIPEPEQKPDSAAHKKGFDIENFIKQTEADPAFPFKKELRGTLSLIRLDDSEKWQRIRQGLKAIKGFSITELEKSLPKMKTQRKKYRSTDSRPYHILENGRMNITVDFCQGVLNDGETIFQRAAGLIRIAQEKRKTKGLTRDKAANILIAVTPVWLCNKIEQRIDLVAYSEGNPEPHNINCPRMLAERICENAGAWDFPYLAGIQECPTITPEGRVISKNGYDEDTCLFVQTDIEVSIPEKPDRKDADKAKTVIDSIFSEYEFETEVDRAVAFSAVLTAVVRRVIPTSPFFGIDAPAPGSGKSLLAEAISLIATGKEPALLNIPPNDDKESEKRFDSVLLAGDQVILIDNIEHTIKSDRLCSIGTQEMPTVRPLGHTKRINCPSNSLWLFTGNNLHFAGDICRRVLKCRINPQCENPEDREFSKDLKKWVSANRPKIIEAAIIILKSWASNSKGIKVPAYGSYEVWSDFVRGAVIWLGMADPVAAKKNIQDEDSEKRKATALIEAWHEAYAETARTVKDVIKDAENPENSDLKEVLCEFSRDGRSLDARAIGKALSKIDSRVIGGKKFGKAGMAGGGKVKWQVIAVGAVASDIPSAATPDIPCFSCVNKHPESKVCTKYMAAFRPALETCQGQEFEQIAN